MIYRGQTTTMNLINLYNKIISSANIGRRRMVFTWTSVKHSVLFPTAFYWTNWQDTDGVSCVQDGLEADQRLDSEGGDLGFYSSWQPVTGHPSGINTVQHLHKSWRWRDWKCPHQMPSHHKGDPSHRELDRLEKWSSKNSMTFNRQVPRHALGAIKPNPVQTGQYLYGWGAAVFKETWGSCGQQADHESAVCHCSKGLNPGLNPQGHY